MASLQPTPTSFNLPTSTSTDAPTCTTAIPGEFGYVPPDACNANYGFHPSWEWNLVFAVAFAVTTCIHAIQAVMLKKHFCWVIFMGSLWLCLCFVLRTLGARDQQESLYVIISTLLFLLAPLWINAFAYMVVARLVHFLIIPEQCIYKFSARWLAKAFVSADVVAFVVQAAGGAMIADQSGGAVVETGQKVYMAGIGIQLVFVVAFVGVTVAFHRRLARLMRGGKLQRPAAWVRPLVWTIFAVLALIVVRIVFRLVEFGKGVSADNPILRHEAYQLCLDALPMLVALFLLNAVHPGLVLKGPDSSFPKRAWLRCGLLGTRKGTRTTVGSEEGLTEGCELAVDGHMGRQV